MKVVYTRHAFDVLAERGIDPVWVSRTIASPETIEPDPDDNFALRAFRSIPERDGRVLRVVYVQTDEAARVITAFFDRSRRK